MWSGLLALALLSAAPLHADEGAIRLKEGTGRSLVEANCTMCHSLDYIQMNSPFLDRKGWEASVAKMVKVMGAPLSEAEMAAIVDYLSASYGK
jgi:cytochrome c5